MIKHELKVILNQATKRKREKKF